MSDVEGIFCAHEGRCLCGNDCLDIKVELPITQVIEVTTFKTSHPGTSRQVVDRLIAIQWVVDEELPDRTVLTHELIPGARRIVLHP